MDVMYHHFKNLSSFYNELRTTDLEPVLLICETLQNKNRLQGADIGCGGGRYDLLLLQHLPELYLICGDVNEAMIEETTCYLRKYGQKNFSAHCIDASNLPLPEDELDFVSTFNAIHHFDPVRFFNQAGRALKSGGNLFVYTRLKNQNRGNIWGRFFPGFIEKEDRLFDLSQIEAWTLKLELLTIEAIHFFRFRRIASSKQLVSLAVNKHYSTFSLYTPVEFEQALRDFIQKIQRHFSDLEKVQWTDENIMIVFRKN